MSSDIANKTKCPICLDNLNCSSAIVQLRQKGVEGINQASLERGDELCVYIGDTVHKNCRQRYINQKDIKTKAGSRPTLKALKRSARVSQGPFDSQTDCLFCGTKVTEGSSSVSCVKTEVFVKTIIACCRSRLDEWAGIVRGRIEYYGHDLNAANCVYHQSCSSNFRSGYNVPVQFQNGQTAKRIKPGRPKNEDQEQAFLKVCKYLENNDEEQLTVSHLHEKMGTFLKREDSQPFGRSYLKEKLKQMYGNSLYFSEEEGLLDIVTVREKTSNILRSYFSTLEKDEDSQKRAIIETAARLIKNDIKASTLSTTDQYPSDKYLNLESALSFIPECLQTLLNGIFVGKNIDRKVAGIGQAIVQAVRPRTIVAPLQIGLAVQVHHLYRSQFLVDTLHVMGFSSSYKEVLRFEKNAADSVTPDLLVSNENIPHTTLLFAADNVDHNILTVDGRGTFHGMGIIAALTPGHKVERVIPRKTASVTEFTLKSKIPILEYTFAKATREKIVFKDIPPPTNTANAIDILWELSLDFKQEIPGWQGMMHIIHKDLQHPGKSSVAFLPMLDMYSGDKSCILSTLDFICKLAMNQSTPPIITFDQPLYWKAAEIIATAPQGSHLKGIILMLGCFHTFMNVIGAIGTLMEGSGLRNIMEVVYGENTVNHMMSGKSIQRAFRGHLLIDRCLNHVIVSDLKEKSDEFASLINESEELYSSLISKLVTVESARESVTLTKIKHAIDSKKEELCHKSKTSLLWIKYQKMLQVARSLIKADRTGSWLMHLQVITDCLPIFAAAGHYNYLKSAYLYTQQMSELQNTHPDVYSSFCRGLHVIRRTDQFWAGLSSDLVIEQTLMRSLKSSGGLTHGSGMTEEMRALWTMAIPITSQYNEAMQEFCNVTYSTSHQHRDATLPRVKRDYSDLTMIKEKLKSCNPFSTDPSLRNIVTGVIAMEEVNVHNFDSIGKTIVQNMVGKEVFDISFKRKDRAKTFANVSNIKIEKDRTIDPALLYQRFLIMSKTGDLSLEHIMRYELSPFPASLFEAKDILRKSDKAQLAHAIEECCTKQSKESVLNTNPQTGQYVLDGGSLLHRLPWKHKDSYGDIARSYAEFTVRKYGKATVVFDGYESGPSIKDNTHQRRGQLSCSAINLTATTEFFGKKDEVLSNHSNKQRLINLITEELNKMGCVVINALGDADVDIVQAAVKTSKHQCTTLIGEDTDLLILLLFYSEPNNKALYFRSDKGTNHKVYDINEIKRVLGKTLCSQLLFIHAFTGCDSTSRIFGVGKKAAYQKLFSRNKIIEDCATLYLTPNQAKTEIEKLGSIVMAVLFGGKSTDSLTSLRCQILSKKIVSATSFVTPERLPPTESSTKYHCLRVYFQIMNWTGMNRNMNACDWGWKLESKTYVPIMTNQPVAPENLLHVLHCNCTTGCRTMRCSCTRYGLQCTSACGQCQTENCENKFNESIRDEEYDNEFL